MNYIDGYVAAVPTANKAAYLAHATKAAELFKEFGAIKTVRDEAWQKVLADPRMQAEANPMPFDGKRIVYGGFQGLLEL